MIEKPDLEKVKKFFQEKRVLEEEIIKEITKFEEEYNVIIDTIRFQRVGTRLPNTIYTELTIILQ